MTVEQLIDELSGYEPDMEVRLESVCGDGDVFPEACEVYTVEERDGTEYVVIGVGE